MGHVPRNETLLETLSATEVFHMATIHDQEAAWRFAKAGAVDSAPVHNKYTRATLVADRSALLSDRSASRKPCIRSTNAPNVPREPSGNIESTEATLPWLRELGVPVEKLLQQPCGAASCVPRWILLFMYPKSYRPLQ